MQCKHAQTEAKSTASANMMAAIVLVRLTAMLSAIGNARGPNGLSAKTARAGGGGRAGGAGGAGGVGGGGGDAGGTGGEGGRQSEQVLKQFSITQSSLQ